MKELGLYIHIPFCKQKCNYCDFYSLPCKTNEREQEYINALISHIEKEAQFYKEYEITTIYIGGGTPSYLHEKSIEKIAKTIKKCFAVSKNAEFTIEANPGTLTCDKLSTYLKSGINRLSLGLQSTSNEELKMLGRIHTYESFKESYTLALETGFKNISLDIMYGLPGQSKETLLKTLNKVIALSPQHISTYCLKIEENTPFYKIKETLEIPSDETEYEMYLSICDTLKQNGYYQYEISNFAKEGFESRHNLKYWLSHEYVGFGPSAHSFVNGKRYFYENDLESYIKMPTCVEEQDDEIPENSREEYVMLRMRLASGIDLKEFYEKFGLSFEEAYPNIKSYYGEYVVKENNRIHFTSKGFFVSNFILSRIL